MTEEKTSSTHPSALDIYGEGEDIKRLAERIRMCLPGGNRLTIPEALAISQLAIAYGLNPFNGEVWGLKDKDGVFHGTMVGVKGIRKAARRQGQYWVEHVLVTQEERDMLGIPTGAIAYRCLVYRTDLIRQSAEAIKMMYDSGMKDAAERYAYKPTIGIGYWMSSERSKMKGDQVARKRAEAEALKIAFDLPFASELGNGERIGYIDAEEWEVLPAQWDETTFAAGEDEPEPLPVAPAPRPQQPAPPAPAPSLPAQPPNGNGKPLGAEPPARKPADLLSIVNGRLQVPYENIHHLLGGIRAELGPDWKWPGYKDSALWLAAYAAAMKHGKAKEIEKVQADIDRIAPRPGYVTREEWEAKNIQASVAADKPPLTADELADWFEAQ